MRTLAKRSALSLFSILMILNMGASRHGRADDSTIDFSKVPAGDYTRSSFESFFSSSQSGISLNSFTVSNCTTRVGGCPKVLFDYGLGYMTTDSAVWPSNSFVESFVYAGLSQRAGVRHISAKVWYNGSNGRFLSLGITAYTQTGIEYLTVGRPSFADKKGGDILTLDLYTKSDIGAFEIKPQNGALLQSITLDGFKKSGLDLALSSP